MRTSQKPTPGNHKLMQYLPHHILDDQPTTCPRCGRRTEDDHLDESTQVCHCMGCHYTFIGEFE
jgi:ribosomal protein L37AE/L43A